MIGRLFTDHPRSVGESYLAHARTAARFGVAMLAGGAACLVHAVVPALFTRTGSDTVKQLHAQMRRRNATAAAEGSALVYEI
ncbi:DUF6356 family protein [Sphingomonas sp. ac-8]|uniref:DUF6356 family protein n=1 Tax=Sphingomonas sp. ac-8 TaxID=3242977 RepID=UPI003A80C12B